MRYIKTFESIKDFKVGDYVFIKNASKHSPTIYKKLLKISRELSSDLKVYSIYSIVENEFVGSWSSDKIRKATKKEIADYMLKINREKYNV